MSDLPGRIPRILPPREEDSAAVHEHPLPVTHPNPPSYYESHYLRSQAPHPAGQLQPQYYALVPQNYPANGQFAFHNPGMVIQRPDGNLGLSSGVVETRWKIVNHEMPHERFTAMPPVDRKRLLGAFQERNYRYPYTTPSSSNANIPQKAPLPPAGLAPPLPAVTATASTISGPMSPVPPPSLPAPKLAAAQEVNDDNHSVCLSCGNGKRLKRIPRIGGGFMCFNCILGAFGREATEVWWEGE